MKSSSSGLFRIAGVHPSPSAEKNDDSLVSTHWCNCSICKYQWVCLVMCHKLMGIPCNVCMDPWLYFLTFTSIYGYTCNVYKDSWIYHVMSIRTSVNNQWEYSLISKTKHSLQLDHFHIFIFTYGVKKLPWCNITGNYLKTDMNEVWMWIFGWAIVNRF